MSDAQALKDKSGQWLLKGVEDSFKRYCVPRLPSWIETYHLTWMTVIWSALVVLFFYFGISNYLYYWFIPLFVVLQYITDLFDGALGRYRNTGLVKWGYYVDHFLDFVFMFSLMFGYALAVGFNAWIFLLFAIASASMVHTFLLVSTNNEFQISLLGLGPTEGRVIFCIVHLVIVYIGISIVETLLPYVVVVSFIFLAFTILASQAKLWKKDMEIKG